MGRQGALDDGGDTAVERRLAGPNGDALAISGKGMDLLSIALERVEGKWCFLSLYQDGMISRK